MGNVHMARLKKAGAFQTDGNKIMKLAEIIRPYIAKWLEGQKNAEGLPIQPATIRAIALNAAQTLIKKQAS